MYRKVSFILAFILLSADTFAQFKLYEKGHDSYKAGKYEEAVSLFSEYLTKVTRDKAMDVDVFYLRGLSYFKKGDFTKAIGDFEETLLLNHPNKANIYWFKAKCHDKTGDNAEAIEEYTNAIRELSTDKESSARLLLERGQVHQKAGHADLAREDFQKGLTLSPTNPDLIRLAGQSVASRAATVSDKPKDEPAAKDQKTTPAVNQQANAPVNQALLAKNEETKTDTKAGNTAQTNQRTAEQDKAGQQPSGQKTEKKYLFSKKPANTTDLAQQQAANNDQSATPSNQRTAGQQPSDQSKTEKKYLFSKKPTNTATPTQQQTATDQRATPVVTPPAENKPAAAPTLADLYKDEKRYALVIGNSAYPKTIGVLKNPLNDATELAKELQKSNFEVQLLTNATYGQMRAAMLKFKEKIDAGDKDKTVSLFYFAGHGLQHEDENYLVPVDAMIEYQDDISRYCFGVQKMVLANMERSNSRMNIVILDACRNNPFPAVSRSLGDQGLGEMRRARGSFIAYATAPGSVASDGTGKNGLYTQELLKAMRKPGLTIEQVFKEVRKNVLQLSNDKQNTWDSSNIVGEFYFKFN